LSTLIPGMIPFDSSSCGNGVPSVDFCRNVSSNRITPEMNSSAPAVVNSRSRYARRFSSVDSTPIESNRFLIVPSLSSAARIPLPGATRARAVSSSSGEVLRLSALVRSGAQDVYDPPSRGRAAAAAPRLTAARIPVPRGRSSVGRASASQAEGRGFEPHRPLLVTKPTTSC
jgi:hypothetical protein